MKVTSIPVDQIREDFIVNCRKDTNVEDLVESIKTVGLQTPIGVVAIPTEGYAIIYGFRRLKAMKALGYTQIDARILDYGNTSNLYLLNLQENVTRKSLSPIEEAEAIQRLIDMGESPEDFAPALGWTKTLITQRLSLLDFSQVVQDALHEDTVSVRQAKVIDGANEEHREVLLDLAKDGATISTLKDEIDMLQEITRVPEDDALTPVTDDEIFKLPEDDEVTPDTSAADAKAMAEANENIVKANLLDCAAKVISDPHAYFAFQVAVGCVDFKKLSANQLDALVSAMNMLVGEKGLDAWGESHKR